MIEFKNEDEQLLKAKGIAKEKVLQQIETFKEGIPFVTLEKAAVVSDGILRFSDDDEEALIAYFDKAKEGLSLLKFVPASGAASRMFKALFNFLDTYNPKEESYEGYINRTNNTDIKSFFEGEKKFPFYEIVDKAIAEKASSEDERKYMFVDYMMSEDGLNFGFLPKGLLPFHHYGDYASTPFEEHLYEAANYATVDGDANLHFTISEQHGEFFNKEFNTVGNRVSLKTKTSFKVGYSFQKPSTDTIAVSMDNTLFRNEDGSLLFRPGGHGALIENLNEQEADIIFIKNIDNVVVPKYATEVGDSKKILAGLLLQIQEQAFSYAKILDTTSCTAEQLEEIKSFLEDKLNVRFVEDFNSFSIEEQVKILKDKINRPIRICGMVKNEGEPGGGPFWVKDAHGRTSLQIIESAQVDMGNEEQVNIMKHATHFNPVDLVCGITDYKGNKYNLLDFVDVKQGFITEKTKAGKHLKALELPGLWNGAMAFWNTIFVEVPLITFNPVKTVNDLLKPTHQAE